MRKLFTLLLLAFLQATVSFSQTNSPVDYPKIIPPSPEATAIGKYGNVPTALFSGLPQISVPLSALNNGSISSSISLDYDASGVRVDQVATNVGLGWSLSAGGAITRSVLGLPDELNNPPYFPSNTFNPTLTLPLESGTTADYLFAKDLVNNNRDLEKDIYYYKFAGYSGKFVYDRTGVPRLIPANPNFKIEQYGGTGFRITDDKGSKYYFTVLEGCDSIYTTCSAGVESPRENDVCVTTAWYLSKVEGVDNRSIVYEYENYTYEIAKNYSETEYKKQLANACTDLGYLDRKCTRFERIIGVRIKRITSNNNIKIEFTYSSSPRLDLKHLGMDAGNALEYVKEYFGSTLKRTWQLSYNYFSYPSAPRLKLLSVREDSLPPHQFYYNETYNLPATFSFAQDHWGYYNGKTANTGLIPPIPLFGKTYGADRNPDFAYMQSGTLNKIVYPTGGSSAFEYEPHADWRTEDVVTYQNKDTSVALEASIGANIAYTRFYLDSGAADISTDWQFYNTNVDEDITGYIMNDADDQSFFNINTSSGSFSFLNQLPRATYYKLKINRPVSTDHGYINIHWKKPVITSVTSNKILIGGLRLKSIKSYIAPGELAFSKYYSYNWINDTAKSSIILQDFEKEYYSLYQTYTVNELNGVEECGYNVFSSSSTPPFGNGLDNAIGYRQVVETSSTDKSNGRTIYKYSGGAGDVGISVGVVGNAGSFQGQLLEQADQKYDMGTTSYINVHKTKNYYTTPFGQWCFLDGDSCASNQTVIPNMQISMTKPETLLHFTVGEDKTYPGVFSIKQYFTISAITYLSKTEEINFNPAGTDSSIVSSNFYYNNPSYAYPTTTETLNSKNQLERKENKYSFDLAAASGNPPNVYNEMVTANMVTPVLEEKSINVTNSNAELSKKQVTYKKWNNLTIQPAQVFTSVFGNSLRAELIYKAYDTLGNIIAYKTSAGDSLCFLWDYNHNYAIAKFINADTGAVAYTSFEADAKGRWNFTGTASNDNLSPTGNKYYSLPNGNITLSGLSTGSIYIVSYWKKNASGTSTVNSGSGTASTNKGGWTLYTHEITGSSSVTISGTGSIDELRLYPKNAQAVTFTYDPLVGMTSQCDMNNQIAYYQYDGAGRLNLIKDADRNVIKRICYNYAGQPEDCVVNTTVLWQSTGSTRCQTCPADEAYFSNIQEHQERDNNPYSATYNTTRWVSDGVSGSCPAPADWQNTVTAIRCKAVSGVNTGDREREQKDLNPCSSTYNELRWVVVDQNCSVCPKPASWTATGNLRCVVNGSSENTGYQEKEERDLETCSSTYNELRWVSNGYNTTACPLPSVCNSGNCSGNNKKCVGGVCETGVEVEIDCYFDPATQKYVHVYAYKFSNNTYSTYTWTERNPFGCPIEM
ncbi:hypothetical protein [Pedobacter sp. ASV28]|uniref:hypothetical protein n=1 Tax=Pedobacter sp. ASV28 TaxID=2795123 RepID=UPI0018EB7236|nr:hypothetical protein [Pedobacter sp. ASV28]